MHQKIFDVRVHLLPPAVSQLVWNSYRREAWPIRNPLLADEAIEFLTKNGVKKIAGICYTSMPGMASFLNDFMAELWASHRQALIPFGTLFPGEPGGQRELERIFGELGFAGIKVHCHLLQMAPDDDALAPIFEAVAANGKVLNLHSGAVAKNSALLEQTRRFCNVGRFRNAMRRTPHVKVIVPHIGYDEVQEYIDLLDEFPNLYFDTAMAMGGHRVAIGDSLPDARPLELKYLPTGGYPHLPELWKPALEQLVPQMIARPNRFLYGSDFPHLPYEWDFEIEQLARYLPGGVLDRVLWSNAAELFDAYMTDDSDSPAEVARGAQAL